MDIEDMSFEHMKEIMGKLATEEETFCCEGDFQFNFAFKIKEKYNNINAKIKFECPFPDNYEKVKGRKKHMDLFVELNQKVYPIELKYHSERKKHNWRSNTLFEYLEDIERIEKLSLAYGEKYEKGYAIILADENVYLNWEKQKENIDCPNFSLPDEVKKTEELKRKRSNKSKYNIKLIGNYPIKLETYNKFLDEEEKPLHLKYSICEIKRQ